VSEAAALSALDTFLAAGLSRYEAERAYADARGVSRLSPYIRSGQLSTRLVWQRLRLAGCVGVGGVEGGGVGGRGWWLRYRAAWAATVFLAPTRCSCDTHYLC